MNKKTMGVVAALGVLAVAGVAFAATKATSTFTISQLDFTSEGTRIYPSNAVVNDAGCALTDYYEPSTGVTPEQREGMDKALAGAFFAGRKVKLLVFSNSGNCGPNGRVMYSTVKLDINQ
jgi:hypothetical protein